MKISAIQCDHCWRVSALPGDFLAQMPALDLHFCNEGERDRYIEQAPPGERAAVLEALQGNVLTAMRSGVCPHSRRTDGLHSWRFDGDDPRIICVSCDEMRDARSGYVFRLGRIPAVPGTEEGEGGQ